MGMFDWVAFKCPCPECGDVLGQWQTKDGDRVLELLTPSSVDNFYDICVGCDLWIQLDRVGEKELQLTWHRMGDNTKTFKGDVIKHV